MGWACTVPTRERADRRGSLQSIIACTERAALHRAIPPDPLTRVYRNRNTVPPPLSPPHRAVSPVPTPSIKRSKPVLATTTARPSPTPPPLRPRRNYKHSFHTKSRWRCPATLSPKRAPRESHFRYGLPLVHHRVPSPTVQPFPKFARLQGEGRQR